MGFLVKFFLLLLLFSAIVLGIKFGVDTCLTDQGSRIFGPFFKSPAGMCSLVNKVDIRARHRLMATTGNADIVVKQHVSSSSLFLKLVSLSLSYPTVFLAKVPADDRLLLTICVMLILPSLLIAFITQAVVEIVGSQMGGDPRNSGRQRLTATYRLVRREDSGPIRRPKYDGTERF